MGVMDHVHLFSGLGIKCTNFPVTPTGDNAFSVNTETNTEALAVGVVDSEELCAVFGVPNTDIVL